MKKLTLVLLIAFAANKTYAQTVIAAKDAAKHIGESVTICDKIYGGKFLSAAGLTLLDMGGGPHPGELLTLLIKGDDRKKFTPAPEVLYKDKTICVTGTVVDYKGKPEIVITGPDQIKMDNH